MNGRTRVIGGLVFLIGILLVVGAIGVLAYNTGLTQGASQALSTEGAEVGSPYIFAPFYRFGPASWLLFCLVVPFLFFVVFGMMKAIFAPWGMSRRNRWGWMGSSDRRRRFEEMAEEWHRQAHAKEERQTDSEDEAS